MTERREWVVIERDGLQLFGVLHLPETPGPLPAILVHHGYGGTKVGTNRIYVAFAEELARAGIATFRFDYRGCGDSEGSFAQATVEHFVEDALAALTYLTKREEVDRERIGVLGCSLGGVIATTVAHRSPGIKSLAMWAPVADGQLWQKDWFENYPGKVMEDYISCGGVVSGPEFQRQFLAISLGKQLETMLDMPLFHAYGGQDKVVFPSHREVIQQARQGETSPSRFLSLPQSNHDFTHPEERKQLIEETTDWFRSTL